MIAIAALLLLLPQSKPASDPATIQLRPSVVVRGAEFTLGDVAEVSGPRAAEWHKIKLGYTPDPGAERRVDAAIIDLKLTSSGIPRTSYRIRGSQSVVRVASASFAGRDISAALRSQAAALLPENAKFELRGDVADLSYPEPPSGATPTLEIAFVKNGTDVPLKDLAKNPPRGDQFAEVRVMAERERLATLRVPVRIRYEMEALVATAPMNAGEAPDPSRMTRKVVDVTNLEGDPLIDTSALAGRVLVRPVAKDRVVMLQDTAVAPIYKKGDQARLVIERGLLRVEAVVRIDADAYPGARVPVTCLEFAKSLTAKVSEDGTLILTAESVK